MLQLPVTYAKVASAVNNCAKSPQFSSLIGMLGGAPNVTLVLFGIFQTSLAQQNQDKKYWIAKLEAAFAVAGVYQTKLRQMCDAIVTNLWC